MSWNNKCSCRNNLFILLKEIRIVMIVYTDLVFKIYKRYPKWIKLGFAWLKVGLDAKY